MTDPQEQQTTSLSTPELTVEASGFLSFPRIGTGGESTAGASQPENGSDTEASKTFQVTTVDGKAILVGPNGGGKTNVLRAIQLSMQVLNRGVVGDFPPVLSGADVKVRISPLSGTRTSKVLTRALAFFLAVGTAPRSSSRVKSTGSLDWRKPDAYNDIAREVEQITDDSINLESISVIVGTEGVQLRSSLVVELQVKNSDGVSNIGLTIDCSSMDVVMTMNGGPVKETGTVNLLSSLIFPGAGRVWSGDRSGQLQTPPQLWDTLEMTSRLSARSRYLKDELMKRRSGGANNFTCFTENQRDKPLRSFAWLVREWVGGMFAFHPSGYFGVLKPRQREVSPVESELQDVEDTIVRLALSRDSRDRENFRGIQEDFAMLSGGKSVSVVRSRDGNSGQLELVIELPGNSGSGMVYSLNSAPRGEQDIVTLLAFLFGFPEVDVVVLDEPLSHLYRPSQSCVEWLLPKSKKIVVMTTHATGMINASTFSGVHHVSRTDGGYSKIVRAEDVRVATEDLQKKTAGDKVWSTRTLLDPKLADLFFARGVIFVEGAKDERWLRALKLAASSVGTGADTPVSSWNLYCVEGKNNLTIPVKVAVELGIPFVVVVDGDAQRPSSMPTEATDSTVPWCEMFQFEGEMEDAVVGTDPGGTPEFVRELYPENVEKWECRHDKWRKPIDTASATASRLNKQTANAEVRLTEARQRLAGSGKFKKGEENLRSDWSSVPFEAIVDDWLLFLKDDDGSAAIRARPEQFKLCTLLQSSLAVLRGPTST